MITAAILLSTGLLGQPAQKPVPQLRPAPATRLFLDVNPPRLQMVGTVVRKRLGEDFYRLMLYVDIKGLRARLGPKTKNPELLAQALASGQVHHAYITRFERGVGRARRMEFLLENLKKSWPTQNFDPESPTLRQFSLFFDQPLNKLDETEVWIGPKGSITTRMAGGPPHETRDPILASAFAATYFGEACMDQAMKQELLSRLLPLLESPAGPSSK